MTRCSCLRISTSSNSTFIRSESAATLFIAGLYSYKISCYRFCMAKHKDISSIVGTRSGRLVVVSEAPRRYSGKSPHRFINTICDCGNSPIVRLAYFTAGRSRSCGCVSVEKIVRRNRTHGDSRTSEYNTWCTMIQRCENPNNQKYSLYGARGIEICKRWRKSYANFLKDMGRRPLRHSIDRIDVDGDYKPSNCRWATAKEQRANQRF